MQSSIIRRICEEFEARSRAFWEFVFLIHVSRGSLLTTRTTGLEVSTGGRFKITDSARRRRDGFEQCGRNRNDPHAKSISYPALVRRFDELPEAPFDGTEAYARMTSP